MARNCIGLDIGSSSIKLVQTRTEKKGTALVSFAMEPLPPQTIVDGTMMNQSAVVEGVRNLFGRLKIKQKDVALAVAGHSVIIKKINVPKMSLEELEEQIGWEAEHHIPFAKEDVETDYQVLNPNTSQGQMEVLLVAAKKEVVHDYASAAREAGLVPWVVEVAAFSLQNAFELGYKPAETETVALINVGATISTINVVSRGLSNFTRDVTIGGNAFTEEIQKQLSVTYEEADAFKIGGAESGQEVVPREVERILGHVGDIMAGEFQRSLDFYLATSADGGLTRIYLAGGSAKIPALRRSVQQKSRLPVEIMDPFVGLSVDAGKFDVAHLRANAPMAAVAVGLSLRRPGDNL